MTEDLFTAVKLKMINVLFFQNTPVDYYLLINYCLNYEYFSCNIIFIFCRKPHRLGNWSFVATFFQQKQSWTQMDKPGFFSWTISASLRLQLDDFISAIFYRCQLYWKQNFTKGCPLCLYGVEHHCFWIYCRTYFYQRDED